MMKPLEHRPPPGDEVEAIWKAGAFRPYAKYLPTSYELDRLEKLFGSL